MGAAVDQGEPLAARAQAAKAGSACLTYLPLLERRRDDPRLLGGVRGRVPLGGTRALGPHELAQLRVHELLGPHVARDRKSTRLNSSHGYISYAVFCLKKKRNGYAGVVCVCMLVPR